MKRNETQLKEKRYNAFKYVSLVPNTFDLDKCVLWCSLFLDMDFKVGGV